MIRPVQAAVLTSEWASKVIAPPHDVLTPELAEQLVKHNPDSFIHVAGATSGNSTHPSGHASNTARSAAALKRLVDQGAYITEKRPQLFVQRIEALGRVQHSLIGAIGLDEHELLAHEDTYEASVYSLAANFTEIGQIWSPVVVASPSAIGVSALIGSVTIAPPLLHAETQDGARISLWSVADDATADAFSQLSLDGGIYILDGHHRVAAAIAAGFEQLLVALVPAEELILAGFDRLVADIDVMPRRTLETLAKYCEVEEVADETAASPTSAGWFGIGMGSHWYSARRLDLSDVESVAAMPDVGPVAAMPATGTAALLDAEFIHAELLPAMFGITEPSDPRLNYRPSQMATGPAPLPEDVITILVAPVPVEAVFAIADRGAIMPPKTTYLVPKVRAGLMLVRCETKSGV